MTEDRNEAAKRAHEILINNPLFAGLQDFYITDLLKCGEIKLYPNKTQIISEGDPGDAIYFIMSGKANVTLYGEEGREIVLAVLHDGDVFGEMSIIDNKPRSANVEAAGKLECFVLTKTAFLEYLSKHHRVYITMFAYLTGRLREATRKIGGLALLDVCGRIAHTLLGMSTGSPKGNVVVIDRPTHEELAAMIGSSREVVSRAIKKMTQEGYIKIEKNKIVLYVNA